VTCSYDESSDDEIALVYTTGHVKAGSNIEYGEGLKCAETVWTVTEEQQVTRKRTESVCIPPSVSTLDTEHRAGQKVDVFPPVVKTGFCKPEDRPNYRETGCYTTDLWDCPWEDLRAWSC